MTRLALAQLDATLDRIAALARTERTTSTRFAAGLVTARSCARRRCTRSLPDLTAALLDTAPRFTDPATGARTMALIYEAIGLARQCAATQEAA